MTKVFISGSRAVTQLQEAAKARLDLMMCNGAQVVIGDASGVDRAVQKHFVQAGYRDVTVYCSQGYLRHNLGQWETQTIPAARYLRGFHFHAVKDRAMADDADSGFLVWDGKSPGTLLNVLRLVRQGKTAVLFCVLERREFELRSWVDWVALRDKLSPPVLAALEVRATPDEWETPLGFV